MPPALGCRMRERACPAPLPCAAQATEMAKVGAARTLAGSRVLFSLDAQGRLMAHHLAWGTKVAIQPLPLSFAGDSRSQVRRRRGAVGRNAGTWAHRGVRLSARPAAPGLTRGAARTCVPSPPPQAGFAVFAIRPYQTQTTASSASAGAAAATGGAGAQPFGGGAARRLAQCGEEEYCSGMPEVCWSCGLSCEPMWDDPDDDWYGIKLCF